MSEDDAARQRLDSAVDGVLGGIADELGFDDEGGDGAPLSEVAESLRPGPAEPLHEVRDELGAEATPASQADEMIEAFISERPPGSAPPPKSSPPASSERTDALLDAYLSERPPPPIPEPDPPPRKLLSHKPPAPADALLERYLSADEDERATDPDDLRHALVRSEPPPPAAPPGPPRPTWDSEEILAGLEAPPPEPSQHLLVKPPSWSRPGLPHAPEEPVAAASKRPPPSAPPPPAVRGSNMPLLIAAAVGIGLAVGLALKLSSGSRPETSAEAIATMVPTVDPVVIAPVATAPDSAASSALGDNRTLIIDIKPNNAYVMFAQSGVPEGRKYAGPWPRHLELAPGKYQLVIFLRGYKTVQTELEVDVGREAQAVRVQLQPDDIYE